MSSPIRKALICLALMVLTTVAFWHLPENDFINYDDNLYVTENLQVQGGLSRAGLLWAMTATAAGNWHPLTWLSHMLDWQLFGAKAGGHHLTSFILHVFNTLLLFLVLVRFSQRLWPSALVAALFALHPLHVESVAWASERKDVLSTCFWLLTMWAYLRYVERPGKWHYLLVMVCFTLGLMAKPMVVTLPFVLLLLDYWPLKRWPQRRAATGRPGRGKPPSQPASGQAPWRLIWEKIPLLFLAALSCLITLLVQKQAMPGIDLLPPAIRLANAMVAYVTYLGKLFWPLNLSVFYPYQTNTLAWWQPVAAALLLASLSGLVIRWGRKFPYLPVGWFWYLGTLVPVIGLVQVGEQAMADRYTYIPLIGIFIILAFGAADLAAGRRRRQVVLTASCGLALLACLVLTWRQVGYWQNSITLFGRALAVTKDNYLAYDKMGLAYDEQGRPDQAIEMYRQTIRLSPKFFDAYNNLAIDLADRGEITAAIPLFQEAIRLRPDLDRPYFNLGKAYLQQGRVEQAREMFAMAIKKNPDNVGAREMLTSIDR